MKFSSSKGFTLLELLVVVAIIGLITAVVSASLNSARQRSKVTAIKSIMISIRSQLEIGNNNGAYTPNASYATGAGSVASCNVGIFSSAIMTEMKNGIIQNGGSFVCATDIADATEPVKHWAFATVMPDLSGALCMDSVGRQKLNFGVTSVAGITTSHVNNGICQ